MTSGVRALSADSIERLATQAPDSRTFRAAILERLHEVLAFEWYAWVLTDPLTAVGIDPLAAIPDIAQLPRTIRLKYLTPINRWTALDDAATLAPRAGESPLWREVQRDHGVVDVASLVLRDHHGCWGFLDLWSTSPFAATDVVLLRDLAPELTRAIRADRARSFSPRRPRVPGPRAPHSGASAVILLDDDLTIVGQTAGSDEWLRLLLPQPDGQRPIPACAYNVAAQLIARESRVDDHEPMARMPLPTGEWVTLRAARLEPDSRIAVTIERSTTTERLDVFARAVGLSAREGDVLAVLAEGTDTREAAARLFVSPNTVQDHLKSIFAKTGSHSRRELLARAIGA